MFLAFKLSDLVTVPFGWLLGQLYHLTNNYGFAMILFGILVQLVLMPMTAKSKKSSMKMSRLTPQMQDIQRRYADDPQRPNQAMQELYQREGVSMGGGCLWSLIPMFILFPLFTVIREPITYILGEGAEVSAQIIEVIRANAPELFAASKNGGYYDQVIAASAIADYSKEIAAAIPGISEVTLAGINFNFFGINLGAIPQFNIFSPSWAWDWAHIGAFLIHIVSAGSQLLQTRIMQKTNTYLVTNEN